jgi:hypothetical protein
MTYLGTDFDWGGLVTTVIDTAGNVATAVIANDTATKTSKTVPVVSTTATGAIPAADDMKKYLPYALGGAGLLVLLFMASMMRR